MPDVTYAPIDTPKPVDTNIWLVDSGPMRVLGMPMPVRMTVIRLKNGGLILHSPTQFSFALKAQLDGLGTVAHLVAPNTAHWSFTPEWQAHFPQAKCWVVPGLGDRPAVQKSGLRIDHVLADGSPGEWDGDIEVVLVHGKGLVEAALFHRDSRTLVLTDLIVNLRADKVPLPIKLGVRLTGAMAPEGKAPIYLRAVVKAGGTAASEAAARLVALSPGRVIFAHGDWYETNGRQHLEKSLEWLLPKPGTASTGNA